MIPGDLLSACPHRQFHTLPGLLDSWGSKDNDRVGCGLIINNLSIKQSLPSNASIFTAEVTAADMAAKESLDQDITASQVPYTDLKYHINRFISSKWQERWSSCRDNKLFQIKPTLGEWPPGFRRSRKEEVVLSRLRIGHTYFSQSYILRSEDLPECTACQEIYSVRHVLIDCIDLGLIRPRFYSVPDMKTLFDTVSVDRIISFVKEINLFSKI